MKSLACPHCNGRLLVNPVGRWFAKFDCAHCRKRLRFDRRTNILGAAGSAAFLIGALAFALGFGGYGAYVSAVAFALWITLTGLSFALRGIEKD